MFHDQRGDLYSSNQKKEESKHKQKQPKNTKKQNKHATAWIHANSWPLKLYVLPNLLNEDA